MDILIGNKTYWMRCISLGHGWVLAHCKSGTEVVPDRGQNFRRINNEGNLKLYHWHDKPRYYDSYWVKNGTCALRTCGAQVPEGVIRRACFHAELLDKQVSGFGHLQLLLRNQNRFNV